MVLISAVTRDGWPDPLCLEINLVSLYLMMNRLTFSRVQGMFSAWSNHAIVGAKLRVITVDHV